MGKLIRATGEESDYPPASGKKYTLEELQRAVGGDIEIVAMSDGQLMVLNEEGKVRALPFNSKATTMTRGFLAPTDMVMGDVVVCKNTEVD